MLLAAVLAISQAAASCTACHVPERDAESGGAHAKAAACVDCHGGNPKEEDKERSHGPAMKGKTERKGIPTLCATCHSDARKMNPYGIPTDQHAQYLTSKHGESLAKGNLQVAVCIDCHGVHGIRRARDPLSPVHPSHVPATCGRCHGNRELMEKLGHPWDVEAQYRAGVHGELLKKGDLGAPQCATCHGNHGAAPPGFADVGRVCGKCHVNQLDSFEASPHAFYAKDGSFKGCVACHANHRIVTSPQEIAGRCTPCHEGPDKEMKKFGILCGILTGARSEFAKAQERLARASRAGLPTDDEEVALDRARTSLLQLSPLQHTLSEEKVATLARMATAQAVDVEARVGRKEKSERMKKLALVPIWAFLAGLAWVFRAKGRRIAKPPGGSP
jgi:hypothetical protein